jgi:hypothetical protein
MDAKSTLWMPTAQYERQLMGFFAEIPQKIVRAAKNS